MKTLLLTRSDVERLLDPVALIPILRTAFADYSSQPGPRALRTRAALREANSATVLFPGRAATVPAYTVKVHNKFPQRQPAICGVVCLHSLDNGDLLAVMDSSYLTAVRTGLSGALAAHVMARKDADSVAIIGTGAQGEQQLLSLALMRPIKRVFAHDVAPGRAEAFATKMSAKLQLPVQVAADPAAAVAEANIVMIATWSKVPFLARAMIAPGTHITSLGADEPGKGELERDLLEDALFVCDDRRLAVEIGALASAGLGIEKVAAELGQVLAGRHPGRTTDQQITVYGGVGLPFQDLAAAWQVYNAAREANVGEAIDFLA